jgi:DNA-binding PadR family transcriptional regulator
MKISTIYKSSDYTHLSQCQTVWWVCFLLQSGDTYQAKIQADLKQYPTLKLSACVLNNALKFMLAEKLIISYQQPIKGRGQPRKMYQVNPDSQALVKDFANLWRQINETV